MIKKRGYLATALLVLAVVGGYVGLLPLLSSLSADPALPTAPTPVANADSTMSVSQPAIAAATGLKPRATTTASKNKKKHKAAPKATTPSSPRVVIHGVNDGGNGGTASGSGGTRTTQPAGPDTGAVTSGLSGGDVSGVPGGQVCSGASCTP
jgi:hypothetical protein